LPAVVVRNLTVATHRALKKRALAHGTSTEAEIRAILEEAVRPPASREVGLGTRLAEFGRKYGPIPEIVRDKTPMEPAIFE
jgi:plasmid stability protein